jgi:hypothetical protein
MTAPIRSQAELLDAIRARRDALNISHETIDGIAGLQSGYTSKLLAPVPIKNLGPMSMGPLLGALGVALVLIEDEALVAKVRGRWIKRKRPQKLPVLASGLSITEIDDETRRNYMRMIGSKGGKMGGSKGGKRRAKTMKKRARQAAASHAARMRWAKK